MIINIIFSDSYDGLQMVALTKSRGTKLEVVELKMLRFPLGVTIMDRIRIEHCNGQRREGGYSGQRMLLNMKLPVMKKRGKPQRTFLNVVKEDKQRIGVIEEEDGRG